MNLRPLLIVLIILCFFGSPIFPYAHWGWGWPGGIGGLLVFILLLMVLGVI